MKILKNLPCFAAYAIVMVAMATASGIVNAEGDVEFVYGIGADDYRSYALSGSVDLPALPLSVNLAKTIARQNGTEIYNQLTAGLTWTPTDWLRVSHDHRFLDSALVDVDAVGYGMGINLEPMWDGRLQTRVDFGFDASRYESNNANPAIRATINSLLPHQHRRSIGISQDLTTDIGISFTHDEYAYTKDPVALAIQIVQRLKHINSAVFKLIGVPDHSNNMALNWHANDKLTFDLSLDESETVLNQKRSDTRLGLAYSPSESLRVGAAITHSSTSALVGPNGATILDASGDDYYELSLRYLF